MVIQTKVPEKLEKCSFCGKMLRAPYVIWLAGDKGDLSSGMFRLCGQCCSFHGPALTKDIMILKCLFDLSKLPECDLDKMARSHLAEDDRYSD